MVSVLGESQPDLSREIAETVTRRLMDGKPALIVNPTSAGRLLRHRRRGNAAPGCTRVRQPDLSREIAETRRVRRRRMHTDILVNPTSAGRLLRRACCGAARVSHLSSTRPHPFRAAAFEPPFSFVAALAANRSVDGTAASVR